MKTQCYECGEHKPIKKGCICQDCYDGQSNHITTAAALEGLSFELIQAMNRGDIEEIKRLTKGKNES
jgi:hypothetical protein